MLKLFMTLQMIESVEKWLCNVQCKLEAHIIKMCYFSGDEFNQNIWRTIYGFAIEK